MKSNSPKFRKTAELFAAICSSLLMSAPAFAQTPVTQQPSSPNSKVNPCPRIFYEPQYTNRVLVPQGCPPNALTQRMQSQGMLPSRSVPSTTPSDQTRMGVGGETPSTTTNSQLNPRPSILNEAPYNRSQEPSQTDSSTSYRVPTPQSPVTEPSLRQQWQRPVATVALANGNVSVKLINETGANVIYQVIGDTDERSLKGKSDVVLQNLRAPMTLTVQRDDGGLLLVTPQPSSETGVMEVRLDEATDVAQDKKAIRVESNGSIYVN